MADWLTADTLDAWVQRTSDTFTAADDTKPSTLRARLRAMPPVVLPGMWPNKVAPSAARDRGSMVRRRPARNR